VWNWINFGILSRKYLRLEPSVDILHQVDGVIEGFGCGRAAFKFGGRRKNDNGLAGTVESVRQTFQWFRDHDLELPVNPIQGTRLIWKIPCALLRRLQASA
jgi:hypothetical protein